VFSVLFIFGYKIYAVIFFLLFSPLFLYKILLHFKRPLIFGVLGIITSFSVLTWISFLIEHKNSEYESGFVFVDTDVIQIVGHISEFPSYRYSNNQYIITDQNSNARILTFLPFHQKLKYNEEVLLSGKVQNVLTQDAKWHQYYRKLDVQYVIFNPTLEKGGLRPPLPNISPRISFFTSLKTKIFNFKQTLRLEILKTFSSHTTALMLGMLFGEKDELSKEEKQMFNNVGISHILVVSGYNIALLISFVFFILKFTTKSVRTILALTFIFLFMLLVGFDGSVLRASLMGSIIIFAKITNRPSSAINVLFVVIIILLLYNPFLIFDAGFHLSCIATFSLLILPQFKKIPEFILTTTWVFFAVAPYIMYLSERFALVSILTNIFILFLLPLFMLVSLFSLMLSYFSIYVVFDIFILETISRYIFFVSKLSSNINAISITITPPILVVLYGIFLSVYLFQKNKYTPIEFMNKHYQKFLPQKPS